MSNKTDILVEISKKSTFLFIKRNLKQKMVCFVIVSLT